jgi:hypothetical protein
LYGSFLYLILSEFSPPPPLSFFSHSQDKDLLMKEIFFYSNFI